MAAHRIIAAVGDDVQNVIAALPQGTLHRGQGGLTQADRLHIQPLGGRGQVFPFVVRIEGGQPHCVQIRGAGNRHQNADGAGNHRATGCQVPAM